MTALGKAFGKAPIRSEANLTLTYSARVADDIAALPDEAARDECGYHLARLARDPFLGRVILDRGGRIKVPCRLWVLYLAAGTHRILYRLRPDVVRGDRRHVDSAHIIAIDTAKKINGFLFSQGRVTIR